MQRSALVVFMVLTTVLCQPQEADPTTQGNLDDKLIEPVVPAPSQSCGNRNKDGIGFRITGLSQENESEYGEFPWMVTILREAKAQDQIFSLYQCGGSLIHPSVVLTAAHCVYEKPANILKIRAGDWDTVTKLEIYPNQERNVTEVVIHEDYHVNYLYNKGDLINDIALLFLDTPVKLVENVQTVCLPPQHTNFNRARCFAIGWGKDVLGQIFGKYTVLLKKIDVPIVPNKECETALRTTHVGENFKLHESFLCAGRKGTDICEGDGGSQLLCPIPGTKDRFYQAGIASWGCGDETPGVYANVPKLRTWIDKQLADRKIDPAFFTP